MYSIVAIRFDHEDGAKHSRVKVLFEIITLSNQEVEVALDIEERIQNVRWCRKALNFL